MRRSSVTSAMVLAASLLTAVVSCAPPPAAVPAETAKPPFKAVADVKLLMQAVVDPSADGVWDAVSTVMTPAGIEERRPRTEEDWARVRNSAVTLTESGNLLMLEPRAYDNESWMAMSRALVEVSAEVLKLVEARDVDGIFGIGERLNETCESCHVVYAYEDSPRRRK